MVRGTRQHASLVVTAAATALAAPAAARADAVIDWNRIATRRSWRRIRRRTATLSFAMVQGAVYDAVNAIDRGHEPYSRSRGGPGAAVRLAGRGGGDGGVPTCSSRRRPGPAATPPERVRRRRWRQRYRDGPAKDGGIARR